MKTTAILVVTAGALFVAVPASAKPARCVITGNGLAYTGPCEFKFDSASRGSFWVEGRGGKPLTRELASVSVTLIDPRTAEVSGSAVGGNSSRWGSATRSARDKACWQGADFKICAY